MTQLVILCGQSESKYLRTLSLRRDDRRGGYVGSIQHIFDNNSVSSYWVIYQNMGHGADELAILDNGTAAHE